MTPSTVTLRLRLHEPEREAVALPAPTRVGRASRRRVPAARILRVAQYIALAVQPEPGLLHLRAHGLLVDAVEGRRVAGSGARPGAGIDDHVGAAGLERVEDRLVH